MYCINVERALGKMCSSKTQDDLLQTYETEFAPQYTIIYQIYQCDMLRAREVLKPIMNVFA